MRSFTMINKDKLIELFIANSDKMLEELEKGKDILIKKNKNGYVIYSNYVKKIN